jgi:integrase
MDLGAKSWGPDTNVRSIGFGQVEDLLLSLSVSDKTKHEMINCFSQFFKWVEKREGIPTPDLPEIEYTLGWRNIIPIELQQRIIVEIKRRCPNVRVYLGVKWLATYIAIRPKEMWSLKEKEIDVDGYFVLPPTSTKEKKPKLVPMLNEDIKIYRSLPTGLPNMPFFRRHKKQGAYKAGEQISRYAFYKWWKKACKSLGIEGVDLYGGTRHSTVSAMAEYFTKEEMREHGTQHGTNKAFERYFRSEAKPKREIYKKVRELQEKNKKAGKVIRM